MQEQEKRSGCNTPFLFCVKSPVDPPVKLPFVLRLSFEISRERVRSCGERFRFPALHDAGSFDVATRRGGLSRTSSVLSLLKLKLSGVSRSCLSHRSLPVPLRTWPNQRLETALFFIHLKKKQPHGRIHFIQVNYPG